MVSRGAWPDGHYWDGGGIGNGTSMLGNGLSSTQRWAWAWARTPVQQGTESKQQSPNSLQRGPAYKRGLEIHRAAPGLAASPQKPPLFCVGFIFSHAFKSYNKGTRFAPYQKQKEHRLLGGVGGGTGTGRSSPPALHRRLGTCFGHMALEQFAAGCSGAARLCAAAELPPMGPHTLPPRRAGKSHQEFPQKTRDPLTSDARDGRGTSAFLRCSPPPPPPPLPHRRPPAPAAKTLTSSNSQRGQPRLPQPWMSSYSSLSLRRSTAKSGRMEKCETEWNCDFSSQLGAQQRADSRAGGAHSPQGSAAAREQTERSNICPSRPGSQQLCLKSGVKKGFATFPRQTREFKAKA